MSSREIRKEIEELEIALADFELQVNNSISKYNDVINEIKNIDSMIGSSNDTLVIQSIYNTNEKMLNKTTKLIEKVENEKASVINNINNKINILKEQEQIALMEEMKLRQKNNIENVIN